MRPTDRERLARLVACAERMAGGDVEHRAEISSAHDEIDALAFAMNVMVGELSHVARGFEQAKKEAEQRSMELAAAQESLVRNERLAVLGQLAGGIAHQIRNPLAAIMNATYILERRLPNDVHPDAEGSLGIVRDEIRHANSIITGLLDFARIRSPSRRPTSMPELVDGVLGALAIPEAIRVDRAMAYAYPIIEVDADQLREALVNIVRNAVEAMPDGGVLDVELAREDDWLVLTISDTGPGIAPELDGHLFEPLRSTKPLGVGLGLVIARTLVEGHGGSVAFVPAAYGASVEIRLPIVRSAQRSDP